MKVLHSICQQMWKTQQWPQDWKTSIFIPVPEKGLGNGKECSNFCTTVFASYASNVILKILQVSLQQCVNWELPNNQAGFKKAEEPEIKLPTSVGSYKMQENSRKTSTSVSLTTLKLLNVWLTANFGKFLKEWEYQTTSPNSWETCM